MGRRTKEGNLRLPFKQFGLTSWVASTLYVNSLPASSRICRTHSAAPPVLLFLPYFLPQDGMKSLNLHWTTSIQHIKETGVGCCNNQLICSVNSTWNCKRDGLTKWHDGIVLLVTTNAWRKFRLVQAKVVIRKISASYVIWLDRDYQSVMKMYWMVINSIFNYFHETVSTKMCKNAAHFIRP